MTQEELDLILGNSDPNLIVKELQQTSYPKIPKWKDLELQYNPAKHKIWDETLYPAKKNENGQDDFKRTAFGLQKLAVNRVAQSMFSTPVERNYSFIQSNDVTKKAVDLFEEVYRTLNTIDSSNIARAKLLNKSCQIATVWNLREKPSFVKGEAVKYKLMHTTYSEADGYTLYPIADEYGELLVLSIAYTDTNKKEHMDVYVGGIKPRYMPFLKTESWELQETAKDLQIFPVVYANLEEPVWGGEEGTNLVEQLEEMESYQGLYIKRNALPTFTLDFGEVQGNKKSTNEEKSTDARRIIKVGKGGQMQDVTWDGANESVTSRFNRLRNAFFEQIQVPDTSFANMISANTSAENKELVFSDARAKAKDLGGVWEKLFLEEITIVKAFVGVMFPSYAKILDEMSVRSVIRPYSIRTRMENAEYVATAGNAMSLETKIGILDEVDDVAAEMVRIAEDESRGANNM